MWSLWLDKSIQTRWDLLAYFLLTLKYAKSYDCVQYCSRLVKSIVDVSPQIGIYGWQGALCFRCPFQFWLQGFQIFTGCLNQRSPELEIIRCSGPNEILTSWMRDGIQNSFIWRFRFNFWVSSATIFLPVTNFVSNFWLFLSPWYQAKQMWNLDWMYNILCWNHQTGFESMFGLRFLLNSANIEVGI